MDITLEYMQYLTAIARIRGYYRTLTPEAAEYFAAERGRWPEAPSTLTPALQLGVSIAVLTTTATMVAFINNIVAGAGITLLTRSLLGAHHTFLAIMLGVAAVAILVGPPGAIEACFLDLVDRHSAAAIILHRCDVAAVMSTVPERSRLTIATATASVSGCGDKVPA